MLTISIILCTRNRLNDIIRVLHSIKAQTVQPQEIIVVDSSTMPLQDNQDFKETFNNHYFDSNLIYLHTKPGLTYQRNQGAARATGDILLFLDDDVVLESNYVDEISKTFIDHPEYAGGMGTIANILPKPSWRSMWLRKFFLLQRDYNDGSFTFSGMPTHAYGTTQFRAVRVLGGCGMAYRRSVFAKHQFDEKLVGYAYMEDCDFSARVSLDAPLFFNPKAVLAHYNSPENRDSVIDNRAMFMRNYRYLFYKNFYSRNRLKRIAFYWTILGLFVEALLFARWDCIKGYVRGLKCKTQP